MTSSPSYKEKSAYLSNKIELMHPVGIKKNVEIALKKFGSYSQEGNYFVKSMQHRSSSKPKNGENNFIDRVRNFNDKYYNNMSEFKSLKEDNDHFAKNYYSMQNRSDWNAKKRLLCFNDLFNKYKEKGYTIPNLNSKTNIFEPSPLLMSNSQLNDYYTYVNLAKKEKSSKSERSCKKDMGYLYNLNRNVVKERKGQDDSVADYGESAEDELRNRSIEEICEENVVLENEINILKTELPQWNTFDSKKTNKKVCYVRKSMVNKFSGLNYSNSILMSLRPKSPTELKLKNMKRVSAIQIPLKIVKFAEENNTGNNFNLSLLNNLSSTYESLYSKQTNFTMANTLHTKTEENKYEVSKTEVNSPEISPNSSFKKYPKKEIVNNGKFKIDLKTNTKVSRNSICKKIVETKSLEKVLPPPRNDEGRIEKLEYLYEKTKSGQFNSTIGDVRSYLDKYTNKVIEGEDTLGLIVKNMADIKSKLEYSDVYETFKNFENKNGPIGLNFNEIKKIKELDGKLKKFDFTFVKELRKYQQ